MRKQFFRKVDSMLPRSIALFPYLLAISFMRGVIGVGMGSLVWNRNSTRNGAFVFGVSDLDVTVVAKRDFSHELLKYALSTFKRVFIFLGETNLYQSSHLDFVLKRMNAFELKRDPELLKRSQIIKPENKASKFVFTQRMLFSDIFTLKKDPALRQSKWKNHFQLIGLPHPEFIDLKFVISALKELSGYNKRICESLDLWAMTVTPELDIYQCHLGDGFKILAPHCYLWFHFRDDTEFLMGLNEDEKAIIKEEVNWEFWGLYTQRYHLERKNVLEHLSRLQKIYSYVSDKEDSESLKREIALAI